MTMKLKTTTLAVLFVPAMMIVAACGSEGRSGFDDGSGGAGSSSGKGAGAGDQTSAAFPTDPNNNNGGAAGGDCSASSVDMAGCPCDPGTTRGCYAGPAGTRNTGTCKDGVQKCERESEIAGKWGACTGSSLPTTENCKSTVDSNCSGNIGCADPACATDPSCLPDCKSGDTKPCYTGPSGTVNVGICKGGVLTCVNGKWDATCTGQVLPASAEVCGDNLDNDCNGVQDCADPLCAMAPACCTPAATVDGTIYANSSSTLYKIDPTTFAMTNVGSFGIGEEMTDVAVTPSGVLYGISFTTLYSINKSTGAASSLVSIGGTGNNSLTFLNNGTLLAADSYGDVKVVNPTNGAVTTIGNYGNSLSSAGDLVAIREGTQMFGISSTTAGGGDASNNNVLIRVSTSNGVASVVGPTGKASVWGLAYANGKVIGFTTGGQILQIDPLTAASTVIATKSVVFWGAGQSPNVPANACP